MYRLYLGNSKSDPAAFNVGSKICLEIVERNAFLKENVRVENLTTILSFNKEVPKWLDGTPTLIYVKKKKIYYGSSARDHLLDVEENHPESKETIKHQQDVVQKQISIHQLHQVEQNETEESETQQIGLSGLYKDSFAGDEEIKKEKPKKLTEKELKKILESRSLS